MTISQRLIQAEQGSNNGQPNANLGSFQGQISRWGLIGVKIEWGTKWGKGNVRSKRSQIRSSKVKWGQTYLISGFIIDCIEAVSWFKFLSRLKFSTFFRWFKLFLIRFSCFSCKDLNEIVQNTKPVSFRIEKNLKI